jgi:colanic acid biosynthesis glycosyl transferase WcaI
LKAVFVNRFFHPDAAPTGVLAADVAFDWASAGMEVHAIAGRGGYADERVRYPAEELVGGVHVHRVPTVRSRRGSTAARVLDYASFHVLAGWRLWRLLRRGDVVVAKTDPPLFSVTAALAAAARGAVLVNWLQDVFPEVAVRAGVRGIRGPAFAVARRLRDWSLRQAGANVVVGERMARLVARRAANERVRVIANWSDGGKVRAVPASQALRAEWGLQGRFVVGYAGNLGRAHDVETLLGAARRLAHRLDIAFLFVGGGHGVERLREARLPNVVIRGYVREDALGPVLGLADVHLVTLLPQFEGLIVPSKFYAAAAAGRPVVFVGDIEGEIAGLVRNHACGIEVPPGDVDALVRAIVSLCEGRSHCAALGAAARRAFEESWDRPVALGRWRAVLRSVRAGRYTGNQDNDLSI